jgi:hypothetical protein
MSDQGLRLADAHIAVSCTPDPAHCLVPGSVVHVRLAYQVPLPLVPDALGGGTPSILVEAEHSVPYGTFREDRS